MRAGRAGRAGGRAQEGARVRAQQVLRRRLRRFLTRIAAVPAPPRPGRRRGGRLRRRSPLLSHVYWIGWASTVVHGPCYKPDLGPRYTQDRGPCYEPDYGPSCVPDRGPRNCRTIGTDLRATAPLDLRASGPTRTAQMHIKGHRDPAPLEPAAGVMSRRCWDRTRTRPTGIRVRWTELEQPGPRCPPAPVCLDPQPSARDPAGAGGVAWGDPGLGWIGLKAESTDEPSRNGPGPRFGGVGEYLCMRSLPMSRWERTPFCDRPLRGSETGELQSTSMMRFPTHAALKTSDTYARLCFSEYSCRNTHGFPARDRSTRPDTRPGPGIADPQPAGAREMRTRGLGSLARTWVRPGPARGS